ncbi:hypothetical protein [Mastigocladopsis repens]|uniref:hypothetical protein n=1 Tax=Mastigocladopsis repens TaxID=221287 RepID=UPI0002FE8267|nr:hypothetical protein [Mastigocladopsis repens]
MIHHMSISAHNSLHVAQVLAELWNGQIAHHPFVFNGYIVFPFDQYGTEIEVYSLGTEIVPGKSNEGHSYVQKESPYGFTATHAAISVPVSVEKIERIAQREGWQVLRNNFGFDYIEFWLENRLLLNLLTPEMTAQYKAFTQPENLRRHLIFIGSATAGA